MTGTDDRTIPHIEELLRRSDICETCELRTHTTCIPADAHIYALLTEPLTSACPAGKWN